MNQIIATAQQILDFKVGAISVGSVIQGLILLIIFNRIISMIMGPLIDKILDRFKLETTVRGFVKALVKVILNFVALSCPTYPTGSSFWLPNPLRWATMLPLPASKVL